MSYPPAYNNLVSLSDLLGGFRKHYLHISIATFDHVLEPVMNNKVQQAVNAADDWLRYASNCWIIWTKESPEQWYQKLSAIEELKSASMYVIKVDISRVNSAGQFPQWIWDWLNKDRATTTTSSIPGLTPPPGYPTR